MGIFILKAYYWFMQYVLRVGFRIGRITKIWHHFIEILRIDLRTYSRLCHGVNLSKKQLKEIDSYWSRFVKVRPFSHAFYTEKTGLFSPLYLPDSTYFFCIDQFYNSWDAAKYLDNKSMYPRMFNGIKLPRMIACRKNGYWFNEDADPISMHEVINLVMSVEESFIKKATESLGGKGVYYFCPGKHTRGELMQILDGINCDIVVQEGIRQNCVMALLNPSSVNTLRLLSLLKKDGSVKIYSVIVRMGIGEAKVDNASSGGITCGVLPDGHLKSIAFNPLGVRFEEHPTTHIQFGQFVIPNYQEIRYKIEKLHLQVPHFRMISWDVAIDELNEPVLIEANLCDGELDFHQLNNGPLFGEDTDEILSEVFNTGNVIRR